MYKGLFLNFILHSRVTPNSEVCGRSESLSLSLDGMSILDFSSIVVNRVEITAVGKQRPLVIRKETTDSDIQNYCFLGNNSPNADSVLKSDYKIDATDMKLAKQLAVKVLAKTLDTTAPSPDKLEFSSITLVDGKPEYKVFTKEEIKAVLKDAGMEKKERSGDI